MILREKVASNVVAFVSGQGSVLSGPKRKSYEGPISNLSSSQRQGEKHTIQ